jgi:hypothetical protein
VLARSLLGSSPAHDISTFVRKTVSRSARFGNPSHFLLPACQMQCRKPAPRLLTCKEYLRDSPLSTSAALGLSRHCISLNLTTGLLLTKTFPGLSYCEDRGVG